MIDENCSLPSIELADTPGQNMEQRFIGFIFDYIKQDIPNRKKYLNSSPPDLTLNTNVARTTKVNKNSVTLVIAGNEAVVYKMRATTHFWLTKFHLENC